MTNQDQIKQIIAKAVAQAAMTSKGVDSKHIPELIETADKATSEIMQLPIDILDASNYFKLPGGTVISSSHLLQDGNEGQLRFACIHGKFYQKLPKTNMK